MQKIYIKYNPYKMETVLFVNGVNVCDNIADYGQFKEFFETHTPLQTWIEPIPYKNWKGLINELRSDEEGFDILEFHFNGREIDFNDLRRTCETENANRKYKLDITFKHEIVISDEKMAQNIEVVMEDLLSDRFAALVREQGEESSAYLNYQDLKENYEHAKTKEFKIVFAGLYSSGKSTILNSLIRHNVLPTSDKTCTAKTCRIRHNSKLKNRVTLECFDKDGKSVVPREAFSDDRSCLERFWQITPLGVRDSVPASVDVIELCMDLSHLYPSKEMEKDFNLVIIDTPGCNSRKKGFHETQDKQEEDIVSNTDEIMALDAITNGEREMIVVCADAQDYDDESIGDFLKAIHEASLDDIGDFNDRFMFVLNKCDALKFTRDEKIQDSKNDFADYLMDTKRWGIKQTSLKFVPRVFMISAYNYFALAQGVSSFTEEEIEESEEKQNLSDAYDDFCKKVLKRKNPNYLLSQYCDVPDYRKKQYAEEFERLLPVNQDNALKIQTGICCIEGAIQDYIARYAYPLKVKDLLDTFDLILESVKEFSENQNHILIRQVEEMGKNTTEREEVEKRKQTEEEKEAALRRTKEKIEVEKNKIDNIYIDMSEIQKIQRDLESVYSTNDYFIKVREPKESLELSDKDISLITSQVTTILNEYWKKVEKASSTISENYKSKIDNICDALNNIAKALQDFSIYGYNFSTSVALKKISLKDSKSLEWEIRKTRIEKYTWTKVIVKNSFKTAQLKFWQIFSRVKQFFASDSVVIDKKITWNEYKLSPLKTYIDDTYNKMMNLTKETQEDYEREIEFFKLEASNMADAIVKDISLIVEKTEAYKNKIESLKNDGNKLQAEIDASNKSLRWLNQLNDNIINGGQV